MKPKSSSGLRCHLTMTQAPVTADERDELRSPWRKRWICRLTSSLDSTSRIASRLAAALRENTVRQAPLNSCRDDGRVPGRDHLGGRGVAPGQGLMPAGGVRAELVEVTVLPFPGHEHPRKHVIDGHPAGSDVGERGVAVGAASVLIAAQRVSDTGDGAATQRGGRVQVDGDIYLGPFRTTQGGCRGAGPRTAGRGSSGRRPRGAGPWPAGRWPARADGRSA